jgi:predicted DNA-binding protein (MmcQ/YjbR family)
MTHERPMLARLRKICRELPGTSETVTWGHPTFKAGGKTFCVLERYQGHLTICFKLSPGDAAAALRDAARFLKTPYIGDKGWVSLIVDEPPDWRRVTELLLKSFCEVAPDDVRARLLAPATRRAARRAAPRKPRG